MKDEKELKQKVAEAAMWAFNEKGAKFKMDDVAAMLKMSKKTLYKLFDSKDELVMASVDFGFGEMMRYKQAILDDPDICPVEKLKKVLVAIPDKYRGINWCRLSEFEEAFPEANKRVQYYITSNWEGTIGLMNECMEKGLMKKVNIPIFRCMLETSFIGFINDEKLFSSGATHEQALSTMLDIAMNGVLTEQGAASCK